MMRAQQMAEQYSKSTTDGEKSELEEEIERTLASIQNRIEEIDTEGSKDPVDREHIRVLTEAARILTEALEFKA